MTDVDHETQLPDAHAGERVDGRVARRQKNIDRVVEVVVEMFAEDALFPTIEQVRDRSGLSLRSLYRYFADPGELLDTAIKRMAISGREMARLSTIGEGPLAQRIDDFVSMRLRIHEAVGAVYRASLANAPRHPSIRDQLARDRNDMREQFVRQFAPELSRRTGADREALVSAGDLLTQIESVDFLRRHRQLTVAETNTAISTALRALLD